MTGLEWSAGSRQRQPAIEVHPCEPRAADSTGGKVAGGFEKSPLRVVAMPEDKPRPERRDVESQGLFERLLCSQTIAGGEEACGQECQIVAGGRSDLAGTLVVATGEVGSTQGGVIARPISIKCEQVLPSVLNRLTSKTYGQCCRVMLGP